MTPPAGQAVGATRARTQRGAALLLAMLTVTLVASLSAAALWQQWRALAVETAERQRQQASWVLGGALDWARLILREDAIANRREPVDHLAEPWALPLAEARLSSFLAADASQSADITLQAFLSGDMVDLQGRLNLNNLVTATSGGTGGNDAAATQAQVAEVELRAFERLFDVLGLPVGELQQFAERLRAAKAADAGSTEGDAPLMPQHWGQLSWLGLSASTLARLAPHATWIPVARTPLNINTASAEALYAALEGADLAQTRQLVDQRAAAHFKDLADARSRFPALATALGASERLSVSSRYFLIRGRLRLDDLQVEERALIERGGAGSSTTRTLWRERRAPENLRDTPSPIRSPQR